MGYDAMGSNIVELMESAQAVSDPLLTRLRAVQEALRPYPEVRLLAVSKGVAANRLRLAYGHGLRHFGENYLQEALDKQEALADLEGIVWHFIGRIQRNKTRAIARSFQWVESVDRELVAERLNLARVGMPPLNVLIEVNAGGEDSKGGAAPDAVESLARVIVALPQLRLRGLMALVRPRPEEADADFATLAASFRALQRAFPDQAIDTLSMGTSTDYARALPLGSTQVRLGTALFGHRSQETT